MYTVKDVAEITGLTRYTIRYYAKEGLLPTVQRNKHGVRQFNDSDLEALYVIECLKICGMKIKEIKKFIDWTLEGDSTIDERLKLFQSKYIELNAKISQMQETLDAIRYKIWYYQKADEAGTVSVHDKIKYLDLPEEMRIIKDRMRNVKNITAACFRGEHNDT